MIPVHAHQWTRGACNRCGATRCEDTNRDGFRCTAADPHPAPHRYSDGTTSSH